MAEKLCGVGASMIHLGHLDGEPKAGCHRHVRGLIRVCPFMSDTFSTLKDEMSLNGWIRAILSLSSEWPESEAICFSWSPGSRICKCHFLRIRAHEKREKLSYLVQNVVNLSANTAGELKMKIRPQMTEPVNDGHVPKLGAGAPVATLPSRCVRCASAGTCGISRNHSQNSVIIDPEYSSHGDVRHD